MQPLTILAQKRETLSELEQRVQEALDRKLECERILDQVESQHGDFVFEPAAGISGLLTLAKSIVRSPAPPQEDLETLRQRSGLAHCDYVDLCRERDKASSDLSNYERELRALKDKLASLAELD